MREFWWYLTRSSGIVAMVLIAAALVAGFFTSARVTAARRRSAWWLDLHNLLGGLALAFTLLHLMAVYQDELRGIGLTEILVPLTADGWRWGITWGVVATYLLVAVVVTSWPRKRGSRRIWLLVHLSSIPAAVLVGVHAWMVGTSRQTRWMPALLALLGGLVVYPAVLRLFSLAARRRSRQARLSRPSCPAPPAGPTSPFDWAAEPPPPAAAPKAEEAEPRSVRVLAGAGSEPG
jgi:DMSO/TMAO reductase YedYZ heme-binding membrane subunit